MTEILIRNFNQLSKIDTKIAGGKGASLGEMTQVGIPVPPGFVILVSAFDKFLEETDLNVEIESILNSVSIEKVHTVEKASRKIQAIILSKRIPSLIKAEILKSYKKLNSKFVAVRSSATSEDSASAAWAGQLESYLNVTEGALLKSIKKCWASLFTPRAIFYRFEKGLNKDKISVAVVVQKMINSEKSGIAFSVHPVTQDKNQIIIEAGFGLGEAIVSGSITPDSYVIDKRGLKILDINVNEQNKALYRKIKGGNKWKELKEKGKKQVLTKKEIIELSKLIVKIENHYGFPCDIEWAKEKGKLYIVQSRPITTIISNKKINRLGSRENISRKDDQVYDIDWELYLERELPIYLFASFTRPYGEMLKKVTGFGFVHQLHYFRQGKGVFYRSSLEMKNADEYYLALIRKKDRRLLRWRKLVDQHNNVAKKLIHKFKIGVSENHIITNFKNLQNKCEAIMLYSTVIPYRILSAINYAIDRGEDEENFCNVLSLYKPLRAKTQYPNLTKFVFSVFWKTAAKLTGIQEDYLFSLLTPDELEYILVYPEKFDKESVKKRLKGVAFWVDPKSEKFKFDSTPDFLKRIGLQGQKTNLRISRLKGIIANEGIVRGRAWIVNNIRDANNFQDGDIVVSVNTNPSLMPILIKCGGIVADEGGIMCHAAIVSRELNKPCIIGTEIATKTIKDGDLIEVDANQGVVRILQKSSGKLYKKHLNKK